VDSVDIAVEIVVDVADDTVAAANRTAAVVADHRMAVVAVDVEAGTDWTAVVDHCCCWLVDRQI